jgi:hypothetical protein
MRTTPKGGEIRLAYDNHRQVVTITVVDPFGQPIAVTELAYPNALQMAISLRTVLEAADRASTFGGRP